MKTFKQFFVEATDKVGSSLEKMLRKHSREVNKHLKTARTNEKAKASADAHYAIMKKLHTAHKQHTSGSPISKDEHDSLKKESDHVMSQHRAE